LIVTSDRELRMMRHKDIIQSLKQKELNLHLNILQYLLISNEYIHYSTSPIT
jgi:hypothetical protein